MKKTQLIQAAKDLGLYVTDSSNAIHAAKNLLEANKRITDLEKIIDSIEPSDGKTKGAITRYNNKYRKVEK